MASPSPVAIRREPRPLPSNGAPLATRPRAPPLSKRPPGGPWPRGRLFLAVTLGHNAGGDSAAQMERVLAAGLACGINHLETAPGLRTGRAYLGDGDGQAALRRDQLVITSKILPDGWRLIRRPQQLRPASGGLGGGSGLETWTRVHGLNRPEASSTAAHRGGGGARSCSTGRISEGLGPTGLQKAIGSSGLMRAARQRLASGFCSLHLHLV